MPLPLHRLLLALLSTSLSAPASSTDDAPPQLLSTTGGIGDRYSTPEKLRAAADSGDPDACYRLAEDLLETGADTTRALTLLQSAVAAKHPAASFRLARLHNQGEHVPENPSLSRELYLVAAKTGHTEAQYNLGILLARGRGGPKEYTEGLAWLILATQSGAPPEGEQKLRDFLKPHKDSASIFAGAEIRSKSLKAAITPYDPAAAKTRPPTIPHPESPPKPAKNKLTTSGPRTAPLSIETPKLAIELPQIPTSYIAPPPPDPGPPIKLISPTGRPIRWPGIATLERAATADQPDALSDLGQILIEGKITTSEPLRAVLLLEKGAKLGSSDAAYQLAEIFKNGTHQVKDLHKSFLYYRQAALAGSPVAMFNLGTMLTQGEAVQINHTEALAWLIVAKKFGVNRGFDTKLRSQLDKNAPGQSAKADSLATQIEAQIRANRAASKTSGDS